MNAAKLFREIDDEITAQAYIKRAMEIKTSVYDLCYDADKQLFAERPDKSVYDQHTNIMAILTDVIDKEQQKELLIKILHEKNLLQATYYYRYYLFEAIKKVNAPELFDLAQKPWETMIANNMTTTLERFEHKEKPTRSEVHPWSASPAYFYFNFLAGIQSTKNNFEEIRIAPVFGILHTMEGVLPTSKGNIVFKLEKSGKPLVAEIDIPESIKGKIIWAGNNFSLKKGKQKYILGEM